jgi:uncharacterized damage-inducible protein DinB
MRYQFLIDSYATERLKVVSVWGMFRDDDLYFRPHAADKRGRSVVEQMVHQCVSENNWFLTILGVPVDRPPLPAVESRLAFIETYAGHSARRLDALSRTSDEWWEAEVQFFDVRRSRAWVMVRRIAHTAHHRGQQMAMLRMLNRDLHSNYGPTADTGGLAQNGARVVYPYRDIADLLEGERRGGAKAKLPEPPAESPLTERPGQIAAEARKG